MRNRWLQWRRRFLAGWRAAARRETLPTDAPALRSELFGMVQLESYARRIAALHSVEPKPGPERLLRRLRENEAVIRDSYRAIVAATRQKRHTAPAAEWLLDNYYLIEEQIGLAHAHLPRTYSRQLPRLRTGPYQGFPRVYDLILQLVSHTDGRVDMENLSRFVAAYQTGAPLSLAELWAVPIMLRLTLIENLRRVAYRIAWSRKLRDQAVEWAQRFLKVARDDPKHFIAELADFVASDPPDASPFVAELATHLEEQDPSIGLVRNWLEQQLTVRGQTLELIHQAESHEQAADQASIANTITSVRALGRIDWRAFVESLSVTETALRQDPSGVYARMDFVTRDRYRHVVERLAREAKLTEVEVAGAALRLASPHQPGNVGGAARAHVGYYLVGGGLLDLERRIALHPRIGRRLTRWSERHAAALFLSAVVLFTLCFAYPFCARIVAVHGLHRWAVAAALGALTLAASRPAIRLIQWIYSLTVAPRILPRLDFATGIPPESRTAVVVPTLLTLGNVHGLLEQLEVRFLTNRIPRLLFGLLTDFSDADQETLPGDEDLLRTATAGIRDLNARHSSGGEPIFFLLHRPRKWNPEERGWMAYERKRGKLEQFNRLVRAGELGPFCAVEADLPALRAVRYVITLDTDTQLPAGSVAQLVGTLAHPLNRPLLDPVTKCVVEGYGVLQPRVAVSLPAARRSRFAAIMAGEVGLDPYTREVSNFYHDLFGQTQFLGKGIYDVEAFDSAVQDRFPENRILSHDLIEGCHARCGFVSDVELVEDHPATYLADTRRRHRWVRGDWQIARWMWPRVPSKSGPSVRNPLSLLSRWMIFDNLRRSLVPLAIVVGIGFGWVALAPAAAAWTCSLLVLLLLPDLAQSFRDVATKRRLAPWAEHIRQVKRNEGRAWAGRLLEIASLPYEACLNMDAIVRSVWRMWVTRRGLLKWRTADAEYASDATLSGTLAGTAAASLLIAGMAALAFAAGGWVFSGTTVLALLWLFGPILTGVLSQPAVSTGQPLTATQERDLGPLAFRTWMYFDHYAGHEHNWLPPDNVEHTEGERVAPRTSPTNVAMGLLSRLAAYDLGYLPVGEVVEGLERMFSTLESMERHQGHFYNWYDTQSLQPLYPRYVSTVDSGNLLAAFVTLKSGLLELADSRQAPARWRSGFSDMLGVCATDIPSGGEKKPGEPGEVEADWAAGIRALQERLATAPDTAIGAYETLLQVQEALEKIRQTATLSADPKYWLEVVTRHAEWMLGEATHLAPWLADKDIVRQATAEPGGRLAALLTRWGGAVPSELAAAVMTWGQELDELVRTAGLDSTVAARLKVNLGVAAQRATGRLDGIRQLAARCEELSDVDMTFLYDPAVHLFHIGYNADTRELDPAFYDLLASEARLGSYVAVARGLVPLEHWFHLSRIIAAGPGAPVLFSWSGSMFEYLMPDLFMPVYEGTLLAESSRGAVARQIAYGASNSIPWGISESGYNQVDSRMTYQYRAFGVPGLGLKRGLSDDLVVAPYATVLALQVAPAAACANLARLAAEGAVGRYGFYEALDYTRERVPGGQHVAIVRSHMAHHSGMSLLAFSAVLCRQPMRRRFCADPEMRANEPLLQERIPSARTAIGREMAKSPETRGPAETREPVARHVDTAATPSPEVHLLSNGRYHVMMTNSGGGYSRWQDLALTRWREDPTRDCWGFFFYLRDPATNEIWSPTHQPGGGAFDRYEVNYAQGTAEYFAERNQIRTLLRVAVSPEDDLELRRLTVTNLSDRPRTLEVTTYAEVALAQPEAAASHPAFQGLFVEAEALAGKSALCFTRRARTATEIWPCLFHLFLCSDPGASAPSFETSRERFLGRGQTTARPAAVQAGGDLPASSGAPLDPVAAIRHRIVLEPGATVTFDAMLGVGATRQAAASLVDKHLDSRIAERVFHMAWTHSQALLHQLKASEAEAQLYGRLAGSLLYANRRYRANPNLIARNTRGQSALWSYAVSGDRPILLLRLSDPANLALVRRLIQAHSYWRSKGLEVDLVIWAEAYSGYRQSLFDAIMVVVHGSAAARLVDQPGGIFVRTIDQITEENRLVFQAAARIVIGDRSGTLETQVERQRRLMPLPPSLRPTRAPERLESAERTIVPRQLLFPNGLGGFTEDGREYVITMPPGVTTPAPWANVMANPGGFGFVVTEGGGSYTWTENAHEFRLTPWTNDPVSDPSGESFYIRDEETGAFWSPTPRPAPGRAPYVCRHGLGYTAFEHTERQIATELYVAVASDAPVKFTLITVRNLSDRPRSIGVAGFCEWVLGEQRERQAMHVVTRLDPQTGAVFASNAFNFDFPGRVAFFHCSEPGRTLTCDRTEFLGRNGDPASPAALRRERMSNAVGAGLDPCAAMHALLTIPPHEERAIAFVLGCAGSEDEAREWVRRFGGYDGARAALEGVWAFWKHQLGGVYVETPDRSLDVLVNHWLLYQVLSARFWGRSAFYQSGGAYGFRDQLQDSLAFLYECPWLTRRHLLLCASRQFLKGDAQHWWHPPSGRGVRSRISDTAFWLPYVACRYVEATGDTGLLDESVPFLEGRALRPDEESYYDQPRVSDENAPMYEHCVRAIRQALRVGAHGLPLMGIGDWNDGMNRVGHGGKGESVWLGFFLHAVLKQFAGVAEQRGDEPFTLECRRQAAELAQALEAEGWDGEWYRRAFFDDGTPLGSVANDECTIDSLPQSWAVLSAAGTPEHNDRALRAACDRLVDEKLKLIRLFTPPFSTGMSQPGYIRGYVPGVRENGGQYTHAGVWLALALAENGDSAGAWRLVSFLNPIFHGDSATAVRRYGVEPYVMAADVYTAEGHEGRGGWTWYTGAAGWMYQLLVGRLLGLRVRADTLAIEPLWHPEWTEYTVHYRYRNTFYHVRVLKTGPGAAKRVVVDDVEQPDKLIHLVDDGHERNAVVEIG